MTAISERRETTACDVVDQLRRRGELWTSGDGLSALSGAALRQFRTIERDIAELARREAREEWQPAHAISLQTLARAGYFASFPQWLTLASHLDDDSGALERIASADDPARETANHASRPSVALSPAVCYHAYERLAGRVVESPLVVTMQGTCWRHEHGEHGDFVPLEREWAFTMREIICIGTARDVQRFVKHGEALAITLAARSGISHEVAPATDPFFAPTARGKELLQRVKGLKREMRLGVGDGRTIAGASFNDHETFFGNAFDIRLPSGERASTGCVAFGLERWLLATLIARSES